jgi:hypothetical protein
MRKGSLVLVLAGLCVCAAACYRYEPIERPRPGTDVRARLSPEAAARRSVGRDGPVLFYDGRVVRADGDSLALDVLLVRDPSVFANIEIRDTVRLALGEVAGLAERRLSTGRSLLLAGALVAGGALVVTGIAAVVGGTDDGNGGGNGPVFLVAPDTFGGRRFPLFRVSIPVP